MAKTPSIKFAEKAPESCAVLIALADKDLKLGPITKSLGIDDLIERAAEKTGFNGKALSTLDILVPEGVDAGRLIIVGSGANDEMVEADWLKLGGKVFAAAASGKATSAFVLLERADGEDVSAKQAASFAAGMKLRSYMFDRYKTKKKENNGDDDKKGGVEITIVTVAAKEATKLWKQEQGVVDGVLLARDLVNEPANILGTEEFAEKAKELSKLGVEVTVLDEKAMKKEKMGALLGVAQGSVRPPLLAIMHWKGNDETPLAFIGKGVVFDTGGISMKPAGGMEEMKGDMGGAAAVTGLMHALAARKAKANVIGVIGLVENMPDANAQRPGDIVTSKSGQTIEVINTDAEGRLVLCDALTYVAEKYEPQFMIDLATLTGAILVALGHQNAGLFSNDDDLSIKLVEAGQATGETLWRMPLSSEYDKLIDSKTADMKNVGPRWGGSISAAQFLQRFVGKTPWAHLDIAGTAMGGSLTEINRSWGTGYGVRLLDRLVRDNYEK